MLPIDRAPLFPDVADRTVDYVHVEARGDEGVVFLLAEGKNRADLLLRAIEFLYHLKGTMKLAVTGESEEGQAPSRIGIGAGIHVGQVAYIKALQGTRSVIDGFEGFEINYAKRVESCSRQGRHSRIMLSAEAAKSLELQPLVLREVRAQMKGIGEDVEVYEVVSGRFDHMESQLGTKRISARSLGAGLGRGRGS